MHTGNVLEHWHVKSDVTLRTSTLSSTAVFSIAYPPPVLLHWWGDINYSIWWLHGFALPIEDQFVLFICGILTASAMVNVPYLPLSGRFASIVTLTFTHLRLLPLLNFQCRLAWKFVSHWSILGPNFIRGTPLRQLWWQSRIYGHHGCLDSSSWTKRWPPNICR